FSNWFFTSFLKYFNAFPVNRNTFDRQAVKHSVLILENEQVLGIFPEGTRSTEGVIKEGQKGVGLISVMTGSDILPMAISGTNLIIRKPHKGLFFPRVKMAFDYPIEVSPIMKKYGNRDSMDMIVEKTMVSISSLYKKINT
ncbi:MAG: 1-acyl-sn-glycerol-3-phosphate acyltransferase, partial [Actinobacteria bacterium]|nr:1-acyl-sn-glycerol-3-phosphate acyltransferase [Actinomycetota bacterium]